MDDLISRQAAIDALLNLHGMVATDWHRDKDYFDAVSDAIDMLRNLPSVQPQISGNTVNLCETCKYDFPECPKDSNVMFGDGKGNDNVCACSTYEVYVPPISKREWYQKGYEAGVKSVQPQRTRGVWINDRGLDRCSICGYGERNLSDVKTNYCPVCGSYNGGGNEQNS